MEPNFNGTLNMRLKWNKIKQYAKKTKDSDLPCHTMDPRGRGVGIVVLRQGLSVETVTVATVVLGRHSGVQTTCIDCYLLVAVDVIQPIIIISFFVSAVICQLIRIILGYKGE
jgi:hypothetical protein